LEPEANMASAALRKEHEEIEGQYAGWWDYTSRTLRLPGPVLTKFFSGNAHHLLHLSSAVAPPFVIYAAGRPLAALVLEVRAERIRSIYAVGNPEKLQALGPARPDQS
jgi:hypothetical protein